MKEMQRQSVKKSLNELFFFFTLLSQLMITVYNMYVLERELLLMIPNNEQTSQGHTIHTARNTDNNSLSRQNYLFKNRKNLFMYSEREIRDVNLFQISAMGEDLH
jgi:hypothetical protein